LGGKKKKRIGVEGGKGNTPREWKLLKKKREEGKEIVPTPRGEPFLEEPAKE